MRRALFWEHLKRNEKLLDKALKNRIALVKKREEVIDDLQSKSFITIPRVNSNIRLVKSNGLMGNKTKVSINSPERQVGSIKPILISKSKNDIFDLTQMQIQPKVIFKAKPSANLFGKTHPPIIRLNKSFNPSSTKNKPFLPLKNSSCRMLSFRRIRCEVNPHLKYLDKLYKIPLKLERDLTRIRQEKSTLSLSDYQNSLYRTVFPILSEPIAKQLKNSFMDLRRERMNNDTKSIIKTMIEIESKEEIIMKKAANITRSAQFLMNDCDRHGRQKVKLTTIQFKRVVKEKYYAD